MRTDAAERFGDERETFDFLVALIREGHVEPALLTEAHLARLEPAVERLVGRLEAADAALVRRMLGRVIAYRADAARLDAEHVLRRSGLSEAEAFRRVCAEDTPMTEVPEEEPAGAAEKVRPEAAPVRSAGPAVRVGYLGRVLLGVAFWVWLFGPAEAAAWLAGAGAAATLLYAAGLWRRAARMPGLFAAGVLAGVVLSPVILPWTALRLVRR